MASMKDSSVAQPSRRRVCSSVTLREPEVEAMFTQRAFSELRFRRAMMAAVSMVRRFVRATGSTLQLSARGSWQAVILLALLIWRLRSSESPPRCNHSPAKKYLLSFRTRHNLG